ncbi:MogA/MoaB family molybdenum cofactor biosynthesis protein [Humibacter antri]
MSTAHEHAAAHEHEMAHRHAGLEHRGRAAVITVSDRAAAGTRADESGPLAAALLADAGWHAGVRVVPDEIDAIAGSIRTVIADGAQLVVTTGGTGLTPRDVTPEATTPLLDRLLPGITEEIRRVGSAGLPTAMLSRGVAGVRDGALIVNLAGSPGAVRDGVPVVLAVADHVVQQLSGGDHATGDHATGEPRDGERP